MNLARQIVEALVEDKLLTFTKADVYAVNETGHLSLSDVEKIIGLQAGQGVVVRWNSQGGEYDHMFVRCVKDSDGESVYEFCDTEDAPRPLTREHGKNLLRRSRTEAEHVLRGQ